MIKCLPKEVQGKLRSGVAVPSLQQCLEELILNSIDAGATCVGVRVDMQAFKVQVVDNGAGMGAEDMERVGSRYHTSKCNSFEDLDDLRWYGFRGEALASIVSLATLVEISSRTRSSVKTHVKMFKDGRGLDVFEAETARPSAGTTVVICNFFHNMPVRRKRVDAVLEGERIRHRVEAISLMHPSVSFTLKNDCTGAMMVQLPKARNTYHRFTQIHGLGRAQKLGEVVHTQGHFEVTGHIGREGHYNSSLQFLYVNERLLLRTRVHKLLNFLLRRLSSSSQKGDSPDGAPAIRSPKHKRSQELHGVYILNIKCPYSEYDICLEPAKTLIEFKDWDGVLLCIEEAAKAFMKRENLVAVLSQDDLDYVSPEPFGADNTDREGNSSSIGGRTISSASTLDCSIGMKLASESVHRKRKNDCVSEDGVCLESGLLEYKEYEAEKTQSEGCLYKDCKDEAQLEPASDSNITEEEEPTFSKAGEASQILCVSSSDGQLQTEKPQLSIESETQFNNTTSTSNGTLPDSVTQQIEPDLKSIEQLLSDCQGAEGHRQTLISNRKICLSDPFIHQSLKTQDLSPINKSLFQRRHPAQEGAERSSASKCKISLVAGHDRKLCADFAPAVPAKIPRIVSCQRLSLRREAGSLDKFRRVFGKSDETKLPSLEIPLQSNARLPQTSSLILNPQNLSFCQKEHRGGDGPQTHKNETRSSLRSPTTLSVFTKLKPVSSQHEGKKSLAAKLCRLKQHRTEGPEVAPHFSGATQRDNACLRSDDVQDSNNNNNNENPSDAMPNPEPASGCSANPPVGETEEDTRSGDWLHHYDTSVGRTVYVNRVTGLSKYEDPAVGETQACCTSDVTNMAVSVVTETGQSVGVVTDTIFTRSSNHHQ